MNTLLPHQQRVISEKKELDEKIAKLDSFIHSDKFFILYDDEHAEHNRLLLQYSIMVAYSNILSERIAAFKHAAAL